MKKNDDVTLNAVVIDITASGNPIIKLPSGITFLVKASDINTIAPYKEVGEDRRKGK